MWARVSIALRQPCAGVARFEVADRGGCAFAGCGPAGRAGGRRRYGAEMKAGRLRWCEPGARLRRSWRAAAGPGGRAACDLERRLHGLAFKGRRRRVRCSVNEQNQQQRRGRGPTVTTTAVGSAHVAPDQVRIAMAVEASADAVGAALGAASDGVDRLLAVLDEAGVPPADRQTSGLGVQPAWANDGPSGHTASYGLAVVVRDLAAAGLLVQAAAENVGDLLRVHGFGLSVRDPEPAQREARRTAVLACRAQAEQVAAAAGGELGDLLRLTEDQGRSGMQVIEALSARAGMAVEGGVSPIAVVVTGVWRLQLETAGPQLTSRRPVDMRRVRVPDHGRPKDAD